MRVIVLLALAVVLAPCVAAAPGGLRVGAASSLRDVVAELARTFEAAAGAAPVVLSTGSSGQLAAQVRAGADLDLFLSAADEQVDALVAAGLADGATRRVVAGNTLVLVVPATAPDAPASLEGLRASRGRVALGEPGTVPAGAYAAQALRSLGLYDAVSPRIVFGSNVRQVLSLVERGEAAAGFVYATDALAARGRVRVVATAPASSHDRIAYTAVVVSASPRRGAALAFLDHLGSGPSEARLRELGFLTAAATGRTPAPTTAPATTRAAP